MLKFFRGIRGKVLNNGKLGSYFIYAIGETILVVIGILVALQINNWNEAQKLKSIEIALLKEINIDLDQNITQIENIINSDNRVIQAGDNLLEILKDPQSVFHDSLKIVLGFLNSYIPFEHVDGAYSNLKQRGLDIIQNDSLKNELRNLFERTFPSIEITGNAFREKVYFQSSDIFVKYFETERNFFSKSPNDFDKLKESQEFINMYTYTLASKRQARNLYQFRLNTALRVKRFLVEKIEELE